MLERPGITTLSRHLIRVSLISLVWVSLTGCSPDNTPLIEENKRLKEQIVKQESLMTTLQEGNRVLQEQIDRLSQELRENENEFAKQLEVAQQTGQGLSTEKQDLLQQVEALTKENLKLHADGQKFKNDARWLRKQRELIRQALQANNQEVKAQTLFHKLPDVTKATLQALVKNGYTLLAKMETDQKSVFITERKISPSASLEVPGYRNQYLMELEAQTDNETTLKVKAEYEEMTPGGTIIEVGAEEVTEIERRLIQVIRQILAQPQEKPAPKDLNQQPESSEPEDS